MDEMGKEFNRLLLTACVGDVHCQYCSDCGGLQMIGNCGYSQRNITIAALSLSIGIGFTQVPEMFAIFPELIRTIFAENCVAVVFVAAIILNLVMPKEKEATE